MSYEPTIYAKENNILYQDLTSCLEGKSWESVYCPENASTIPKETDTISNGLIYAWKRNSLSKDFVATLLENNNDSEIQNKLDDGSLATCEFFIDNNYSINDEYEDHEIEELTEEMGEDYVAHLRKAKCTVTSRSNSGCGPLTSDFHVILLDILIELTNGFCDDE